MGRVEVPELTYIPKEGIIYLDTSAYKWAETDERSPKLRQMEKVKKLSRVRGRVITTPSILKELQENIHNSNNRIQEYNDRIARERTKGNRKSSTHRYWNHDWKLITNRCQEEIRITRSLIESLKENEEHYGEIFTYIPLKETTEFVRGLELKIRGYGKALSPADIEIVVTALSNVQGNDAKGVGIFTADKPMMQAYELGVKRFSIPYAFICDATSAKTYYL